jgi:hypothetical protein
MGEKKQTPDLRDSNPNAGGPDGAAGGMGVSSERTGPAGPGQHATDGVRDVTPAERSTDEDTPPEQRPGNPEENPEGLPPKSGYSSVDPRSKDS